MPKRFTKQTRFVNVHHGSQCINVFLNIHIYLSSFSDLHISNCTSRNTGTIQLSKSASSRVIRHEDVILKNYMIFCGFIVAKFVKSRGVNTLLIYSTLSSDFYPSDCEFELLICMLRSSIQLAIKDQYDTSQCINKYWINCGCANRGSCIVLLSVWRRLFSSCSSSV